MKVTKNDFLVYDPEPEVVYDDNVEGGGIRIVLPGMDGDFIEISDASDDFGKPRLQIRSSGKHAQAILVRPQVANSILVFLEDLYESD